MSMLAGKTCAIGPELWIFDFTMCSFLGGISRTSGIMDVGGNLPVITGSLTKGRGLELYWSMTEKKEVYFKTDILNTCFWVHLY